MRYWKKHLQLIFFWNNSSTGIFQPKYWDTFRIGCQFVQWIFWTQAARYKCWYSQILLCVDRDPDYTDLDRSHIQRTGNNCLNLVPDGIVFPADDTFRRIDVYKKVFTKDLDSSTFSESQLENINIIEMLPKWFFILSWILELTRGFTHSVCLLNRFTLFFFPYKIKGAPRNKNCQGTYQIFLLNLIKSRMNSTNKAGK